MTGESFQRSLEALRPKMLSTARRYFPSDSRAEDVVQDALLRMWELRETLSEPLDGFASVLVRNLAVDALRRNRPTVDIDSCEVPTPEDGVNGDDRYARIMNIVDSLPLAQQTILRLRLIDEMEYADVAALTGMAEAAVRQTISRARRAILLRYSTQS